MGVNVQIPLRAVHSIGSRQYGPGLVTVPRKIAATLIHQDKAAIQADRDWYNTEPKCFVVKRQIYSGGERANVGVQVKAGFFDDPSAMIDVQQVESIDKNGNVTD